MISLFMNTRRKAAIGGAFALCVGFAFSANSQTAAPVSPAPAPANPPAAGAGPSPARQAIEARKAVFTLIGGNFRPIGNVLKGAAPYDAVTIAKSVARIAFLSQLLDDTFPEISNLGEPQTKAKPDIWTNRADFDKKLKDFQTHAAALQKVNETDQGPTDAFKVAAAAVGQDCKACHDNFRVQ